MFVPASVSSANETRLSDRDEKSSAGTLTMARLEGTECGFIFKCFVGRSTKQFHRATEKRLTSALKSGTSTRMLTGMKLSGVFD